MNLPDPYVYHDAGMTTTWEYFGYYRQLDEAACQAAWVRMLEDTREQVVSGHGNVPVGTEARHWSGRSGDDDWVDLVVIPREAMTWRMLLEGFVGGIIVCAHVAKGYQFGVIAEGVEGEVAVGQVTTRVSRVVTA